MALTEPTTPTLERFQDQTTVVLTSYRRDGMVSPVSRAVGCAYAPSLHDEGPA